MRDYFEQVAGALDSLLQGDEVYTCSFAAEDSDFVRFNASEVRQAGSVTQRELDLDLIEGGRHAAGSICLSGDLELDRPRLQRLVGDLRERRRYLPEDPFLLYNTEVQSSERTGEDALPDPDAAVAAIQDAGRGRDLVGVYASGGIHRGFANSLGQRNWLTNHNFNFDWSFYHSADKAVKERYAGFSWDPDEFRKKVSWASERLDVVKHPAHGIDPGRYRVYLSPMALYEIVQILSRGGFGLKAHKTRQTPLLKMVTDGVRLNPQLTLREHTAAGIAPDFQEAGFLRPERVDLIAGGAYGDHLVSPRSAKEYGVATNGASAFERPESLDVLPGQVSQDAVLDELGTGIYVGNLWYLNYSDVSACRTTGMTRFATFWVEGGRIKAPLNVMRFDETAYRVLGDNLMGLTAERDLILDANTLFRRHTETGQLPGALVDDFTFTL